MAGVGRRASRSEGRDEDAVEDERVEVEVGVHRPAEPLPDVGPSTG